MMKLSWDVHNIKKHGPDPTRKYIGRVKLHNAGMWQKHNVPAGTIGWVIFKAPPAMLSFYYVDWEGIPFFRNSYVEGWAVEESKVTLIDDSVTLPAKRAWDVSHLQTFVKGQRVRIVGKSVLWNGLSNDIIGKEGKIQYSVNFYKNTGDFLSHIFDLTSVPEGSRAKMKKIVESDVNPELIWTEIKWTDLSRRTQVRLEAFMGPIVAGLSASENEGFTLDDTIFVVKFPSDDTYYSFQFKHKDLERI